MEPDLENGDPLGLRHLQRWFRRAVAPPAGDQPEASVLAFASGKGGTGKSFLATNVAVSLSRRGMRVVVVDCDFGLGNAHLLFGVNPPKSMQHLLCSGATVEDVMVGTPHGPLLIAGGSGIAGLSDLGERQMLVFGRALAWLARRHDVLVLDCAAGLSPQTLLTALAARDVVLVTNPEIAALTDAYALVKCLAKQPQMPSVHVVVNRVVDIGQGWPTFQRLADVSRRFAGCSIHYAGEVPEDPAVTHRRLGQAPLLVSHPQCPTTLAIESMLDTLQARIGPFQPRPTAGDGVERRVVQTLNRR